MPEPFKNLFNPQMINQMAGHLQRVNPEFDNAGFVKLASRGLSKLELKERSNQIRDALTATLNDDFSSACQNMLDALHPVEDAELGDMSMDDKGIRGWAIMPMADFVAMRGLENFNYSLDVLAGLTKRFSAEFAVRHFFVADSKNAMQKSLEWAEDENVHVRRLASEGSRPRLPWGIQLTGFVDDPTPLLPVLNKLKNDDNEYVRRSVANNLNDIAKDHPDVVATTAGKWLKDANPDQVRMVKHACRSLIKQGHKPTLTVLGYKAPKISVKNFQTSAPNVMLGSALEFSIELTSVSKNIQPLIIDFVVHHRKANGSTSPKTFKWKVMELAPGKTIKLAKKHPMKPITTRVFYEGVHGVEIQVNGESFGKLDFSLTF